MRVRVRMPPADIQSGKLLRGVRQRTDAVELLRRGHLAITFDQQGMNDRVGVAGDVDMHRNFLSASSDMIPPGPSDLDFAVVSLEFHQSFAYTLGIKEVTHADVDAQTS